MKQTKKNDTSWQAENSSRGWYSSYYRKRRSKSDWAGITLGDAFRPNLDPAERLPAQNLFYRRAAQIQAAVHRLAGHDPESSFEVKPQLSPLYTQYPAVAAAYAAIGLTGYLEYEAVFFDKVLSLHLGADPESEEDDPEPPAGNKHRLLMVKIIEKAVRIRILLQELSALPAFSSLEIHRLFMASQQDLRFRTVIDVVFNGVLYGELLPDFGRLELHPVARRMLDAILTASRPHFDALGRTEPGLLVELGNRWGRDLVEALAPLVTAPVKMNPAHKQILHKERPGNPDLLNVMNADPDEPAGEQPLQPLDRLNPPLLIDPDSIVEQMAMLMINNLLSGKRDGGPEGNDPAETALLKFIMTLRAAGIRQRSWEDLRSDLIERMLHFNIFDRGLMEGSPSDGQEIEVPLADGKTVTAEIFDRTVPLSDDPSSCLGLEEEAAPVTEALRRSLYPNVQKLPETDRLRTSGSLDTARLALGDFSPAVFKRYRMRDRMDRRGRPVLAIACDGSGSLNRRQMRMLKVLTAAWLKSTARSEIQLMAGLYHSGEVRPGLSGPLVQWIFHPQKTPVLYRLDAMRTLPELPDTGTGMQSDAVSIAYFMREARSLARGRMVYLILITDCQWNRSFPNSRSGREEVQAVFASLNAEMKGKLHTTMVALGQEKESGLENLVDKIIPVLPDELTDAAAVARKIGQYVASCIRERRRTVISNGE
ncbi:hypothetical protein JW777_10730 [bacterium]|nr:hypothetical protein [bacterium]